MTIATTVNKVIGQGNGATTSFAYSFLIPAASNAVVTFTDAYGNQTVLTPTQYGISGLGSANGGTITYPLSGPPMSSGQSITLQRVMPLQQLTSLINQSGYFPAVVEGALDSLEMQIQQIYATTGPSTSLQFPASDPPTLNAVLPAAAARANTLLSFDSAGNVSVVAPSAQSATALAAALASTANAASGAGMVGFLASLSYAAGTVGGIINSLLASAGSSLIGFIQSGTGAVSRYLQSKARETLSVMDFGAVGDGVTNDAAAINLAYAQGGTIWHPPGTYYLGTTQLNIPSNTKLIFSRGAKFTVNSAVPASMPQAYLMIQGSNVEIDGAAASIGVNPFTTYTGTGAFIGFGASNISGVRIRNCDAGNLLHGVLGSSTLTTVANSVSDVVIERNKFTSYATCIYHTGKSPTNWLIDGNKLYGTGAVPSNNSGAIGINCAVDIANINNFTQSNYDNDCGVGITVVNNQIGAVLDRPIRLMNCKQVVVHANVLKLGVGSYFTGGAGTTYSADAITFDCCRQIVITNNNLTGGGENGIDFLSCQDWVCHDNVVKQCNTNGIYVYLSDLWTASGTSPKLSSITTRTSLQNINGDMHDNYIEAFFGVYVGAGQNIKVHDNNTKVFRGSTNWATGAVFPQHHSIDNTSAAAYFTESAANWPHDVTFYNNKPVLTGSVSVTYATGTGIFTTVGGVAHGFVTGDLVETVASGTSTTVDYPAGLDYKVSYYVIYVSATTFKLAATWANAFSGTNIATTTNGLTTSGSALLVREDVWPAGLNITASYYSPDRNIVMDPNVPGYTTTNLFSTFPTLTPSIQMMFKGSRNQLIYDPAVNYGVQRNYLDKYIDIPPLASDGTTVYGMSPNQISVGGYVFNKGAKPAKVVGTPSDGYVKTTFW